jgi:hypothetical protein
MGGYVARMGEMRKVYKVLFEKPGRKTSIETLA